MFAFYSVVLIRENVHLAQDGRFRWTFSLFKTTIQKTHSETPQIETPQKTKNSAANIELLRKMNVFDREGSISPEQWEVFFFPMFFQSFFFIFLLHSLHYTFGICGVSDGGLLY